MAVYPINTDVNPFPLTVGGGDIYATVASVPSAASAGPGLAWVASIDWLIYSDGAQWFRVLPPNTNFPVPVVLFDRYLATALEQGFDHVWPLSGGYATPTQQFDYGSGYESDILGIAFQTGGSRVAAGLYPAAEGGSVPIVGGGSWFQIEGDGVFPFLNYSWAWWLQPNTFSVVAGFNNVGFGGGTPTVLVCTNDIGAITLRVAGVEVVASAPVAAGSKHFISLTRAATSPGAWTLYLDGALVGSHSAAATNGTGWFINTASADAQYQGFCFKNGVITLAQHQALYAAAQVAP